LSESKAAGLETGKSANRERELPVAVPDGARTGRSVAGKTLLFFPKQSAEVVFPPEPPVATPRLAERPAAVQGAPFLGVAQRTLDGEDRSATPGATTGGSARKTTFPAGELRAL
jgi:hypothetical protein